MRSLRIAAGLIVCLPVAGCWSKSASEVVVYTALDAEFSEPIFEDFTKKSGVQVQPKFDIEAHKTVGLVTDIIEERKNPRCDVFWNNEILHTLRLKRMGLLEVYRPPIAEEYPEAFRSSDGRWHGFAARARVLIVNTKKLPEVDRPGSIHDLTAEKWRGKGAIARPLFGTTATHAACLFATWGDEKARGFFRRIKANDTAVLSGNKQVALSVSSGQYAFGLTDTDDAIIELEAGKPVAIVYPDQGEGEMGTLFIPNTLAIVRGGPNPKAARRLVGYLLSREVEARLAAGRSAQIPLNPNVKADVRVKTPKTIRPMPVDFEAAAEKWDPAEKFLKELFLSG